MSDEREYIDDRYLCRFAPCHGELIKVAPLLWRCSGDHTHLWVGNPEVRLTPVIHESERTLASELEIAGQALAAAESRASRAEAEVAVLIERWPDDTTEPEYRRGLYRWRCRWYVRGGSVGDPFTDRDLAVRAAAGLDAEGRADA